MAVPTSVIPPIVPPVIWTVVSVTSIVATIVVPTPIPSVRMVTVADLLIAAAISIVAIVRHRCNGKAGQQHCKQCSAHHGAILSSQARNYRDEGYREPVRLNHP